MDIPSDIIRQVDHETELMVKVEIIIDINRMLVIGEQEPLNDEDFDILYDLSLPDLHDARAHVKEQLRVINPRLKRLKRI